MTSIHAASSMPSTRAARSAALFGAERRPGTADPPFNARCRPCTGRRSAPHAAPRPASFPRAVPVYPRAPLRAPRACRPRRVARSSSSSASRSGSWRSALVAAPASGRARRAPPPSAPCPRRRLAATRWRSTLPRGAERRASVPSAARHARPRPGARAHAYKPCRRSGRARRARADARQPPGARPRRFRSPGRPGAAPCSRNRRRACRPAARSARRADGGAHRRPAGSGSRLR
mmetsp:Transcript_18032/g.50919  ORF Transcript_18032/g.50919 Transcript_18032/m.50919 type:complete len:233 (+) Transcript_18032:1565-2263(+)